MFLGFWILWALIGLAAATALFAWSIRTKQFENSRRASLLPFDDVAPVKPGGAGARNRGLFITIALLIGLGIITTIIMVTAAWWPR